MPLDVIVTSSRFAQDPASREFLTHLRQQSGSLELDEAIAYYDFPAYLDYESNAHRADVVLLSPAHGVVAVKFVPLMQEHLVANLDVSLSEYCSNILSRLLRSRPLRKSLSELSFSVTPVLFVANLDALPATDSEVCTSYEGFSDILAQLSGAGLDAIRLAEARSVLEGAKALTRPLKRVISDPDAAPLAVSLAALEAEIANFDEKQRRIALVDVGGPARIRGLAGSGKTVILAMKAAHLHIENPEAKILVTFYTKSLRSTLKSLITKFYRHYSESDPDWNKIHIRHGWGSSSVGGVYNEAAKRQNVYPMSLGEAQKLAGHGKNAFGTAIRALLDNNEIAPFYDHVLIDEGQDFPDSFYELCYFLAKGERDRKSIVWAYDDLQNILNVEMRSAERLFGTDADGQARVSLDRSSAHVPIGAQNDAVLSKTYRNQRSVLVTSHALGFGVYGQIVQMLESADHWRDVGYEVETGALVVGERVRLIRPAENSPTELRTPQKFPVIEWKCADDLDSEIAWIVDQITTFIANGLSAEDILVISLDDRHAKRYFRDLTARLAERGVSSNNIIADPYNEPPFCLSGKVTLSTVYRAKGNEAALVLALGVDAVDRKTRGGRNKLFTAFTRTKGWLRISGIGPTAQSITAELATAVNLAPAMEFTMPDTTQINTIQRDLSKKQAKAKAAREEFIRKLKAAGLTDEEIQDELSAGLLGEQG